MATKGKKTANIRSNTKKGSESGEMRDSLRSLLQKGSETAYDYHCDLCEKDNKYVEAVGYCCDCTDYLCQECYNYHLKPKPSQHHILLDQHRMPKDFSQRQSKDICTEQCAVHKHETLKYYCAEHDTFGCTVCVTLHHRNCEGVDYIPDIAGDVLKSREYKEMTLKVKTLTKSAQKAINTTQNKTQTSNQQHSNTSEFFKQLRKDLNAAVDKLETLVMKDAGRIRDENQKRIKSVEDQYTQLLKDIGALDSKFTSLENKGQLCQIFFSMKRSQDEITALEASLLQLQDQSHITEYVIKINDDLQKLIQQPETMATLELTSGPQISASQDLVSSQPAPQQVKVPSAPSKPVAKDRPGAEHVVVRKTEKNKTTTAVHVADIGVRVEVERKSPWITGSVVLPGDKLVIVDSDNATVKLINLQSNQVVSHLKCDSLLQDISAVTSTQVAVTSLIDNTILFINVTNTLTLDHKVKVKGECRGIACISEDKFVITYNNPAKVEIISRRGELLQTVVTEDRGRQLFTYPHYVAVSPDQQTIYISDISRYTVTSLDLSGQVKTIYKDNEYPRGLTVDRAGVLYVCGMASNNIHQLTPDLHKIQILLQESDGIVSPTSVSYNEEQNQLYIGMWINDKIKVYQLH